VRHTGTEVRRIFVDPRGPVRRLIADPRAPTVALVLILVFSCAARLFDLGRPCSSPCRHGSDHSLIFDEAYYVNAARVIVGIHPPAGAPYADAPLHKDPNAEHPQLAKLFIAGGIKLFGDNPWGWRLGSVLFGLLAIAGMYFLARAAGGTPWLAVGAAGVAALDNLMLIHGRIATLDVYAVSLMIIAAALYLRGNATPAGIVLGLGACMKLVALFLVPVFVLLEILTLIWARRDRAPIQPVLRSRVIALAITVGGALVTLVLVVWLLDALVPAYDPGTSTTYAGNPFAHISHMLSFAAKLKAVPDATGISSTPWQWLVNQKPIDYSRVAVNQLSNGKIVASRALFAARGEMNPFIIFLFFPALFAAVAAAWRQRDRVAAIGAAWCLGTFVPFVIQSQAFDRISYLYYMLIVLPGLYLLVAWLFSPSRVGRAATLGLTVALIYSFIDLYPVQSLSGH
jgi:predicted membrane-bound dolichyl-phosphate-mannose-protein mannosyltransferase